MSEAARDAQDVQVEVSKSYESRNRRNRRFYSRLISSWAGYFYDYLGSQSDAGSRRTSGSSLSACIPAITSFGIG